MKVKILSMYKNVLIKYVFLLITGLEVIAGESQWIQKTIDFTINNNFTEAIEIVEKRIKSHPDDYRAHFYIAATLNSKMTHFENDVLI